MSIGTEITRLQNAKAAIKTAIAGKGVTVAEGTLLDGMAALIDSIAQSPFPGDVVTQLYVGTVVPATDKWNGNLEINHNLGVIPDLVLLARAASGKPSNGGEILCVAQFPSTVASKVYNGVSFYSAGEITTNGMSTSPAPSNMDTVATLSVFTSARKLIAGTAYLTMALKFA